MEGKDLYARSNKVDLCDDGIFHEPKIINIMFPSDPFSVDKTVWPKFSNLLRSHYLGSYVC